MNHTQKGCNLAVVLVLWLFVMGTISLQAWLINKWGMNFWLAGILALSAAVLVFAAIALLGQVHMKRKESRRSDR